MNKFQAFFKRKAFYTNKYFIAFFLFAMYVTIFSQNNLIERIDAIQKRNELLKQREYYQNLIKEHSEKIKELQSNKALLEKFVREEYLMKRMDEVIFLVVDSTEDKK